MVISNDNRGPCNDKPCALAHDLLSNKVGEKLRGIWIYALTSITIYVLSLIFPLMSFAQEMGLSGLIQLTYQDDRRKDTDTESKKSSFTQDYRLQYQGFVYSPRLLIYNIGGTFRRDDSDTEAPGAWVTTTRAKSLGYHLRLDFIQGTRYPFTIFKERSEFPTRTFLPAQITLRRMTSERYGIFGRAFLGRGVNLRYDMHQDNIKTTGQAEVTDQRNRSLMLGIDSSKEHDFIDVTYTYRHNFEKIKNQVEAINDAGVRVGLKPGKPTMFNADMRYTDNSLYEFTSATANMHFSYLPSPEFHSDLSLYASHIEHKQEEGNFFTFFGNSTYRISPFFTTNQNLMLYKSTGDFGGDATQSLTLGLDFTRHIPVGLTFSADTSINGTAQQFEKLRDRASLSYAISGRVSKFFGKINTEIHGGGSYRIHRSSLGGRSTRYALNSGSTSHFIIMRNLTLNSLLNLNYSEEEIIGDEIDGEALYSKTRTMRIASDNFLIYSIPLGGGGSLDARAGAMFEVGNTQRTFKYANLTSRYALRRDLVVNAGLNFSRESITDATTISGSLGVEYRLRAIIISLRNDMRKEIGPRGTETRTTTFIQASRLF